MRYEGDLILEGDEALTIVDCILEVTGSIYVKDDAMLRLENVDVRFIDPGEAAWHRIVATGSSKIEFLGTRSKVGVELYDSSIMMASCSTLISHYNVSQGRKLTYGGVFALDGSKARVMDSKLGYVAVYDNATAEVSGSDMYTLRLNEMEVTVTNSTVEVLMYDIINYSGAVTVALENVSSIDLGSVLPGLRTTLRNVVVDGVWLRVYDSDIAVADSKLLYMIIHNNTRLSLKNSALSGLYFDGVKGGVEINGCHIEYAMNVGLESEFALKIADSYMGEINLEFSAVNLDVSESVIGSLCTYNLLDRAAQVQIRDSAVDSIAIGFGENAPIHYRLSNVTISGSMSFKYGTFRDSGGAVITGDINFGPGFWINHTAADRYSLITRMYNLSVTEGYEPKGGVKLELLRGDEALWSGETDETGRATFPVKYARIFVVIPPATPRTPTVIQVDNITDTLRLRVGEGRSSAELKVGLTTDTPIAVNLTRNYEYGLAALPLILAAIGLYLIRLYRGRIVLNG